VKETQLRPSVVSNMLVLVQHDGLDADRVAQDPGQGNGLAAGVFCGGQAGQRGGGGEHQGRGILRRINEPPTGNGDQAWTRAMAEISRSRLPNAPE
jgi:hypothetical protein